MAGPDDPDEWDFEGEDTRLDELDAIPEAIDRTRDSTGKYLTLQGQQMVDREVELARARADQIEYDMMALKLAMMEGGTHPAIAEAQVDKLRRWAAVPANDHLIRVMLKRA
jgi:uncharacterized protein YwlG (UPF0340 family)